MIERAAANQLQTFLEDSLAVDPFQSGFRPGHGVKIALVALLYDLRKHLDQGGSALLVLLDLTAAFDTVDHELLICRLTEAGIQGTALKWLTSFLHNRNQSVMIRREIPPIPTAMWCAPRCYSLPNAIQHLYASSCPVSSEFRSRMSPIC